MEALLLEASLAGWEAQAALEPEVARLLVLETWALGLQHPPQLAQAQLVNPGQAMGPWPQDREAARVCQLKAS